MSISNCNHVLNPDKVNERVTKLVCTKCGIVVAWWIDDNQLFINKYSDDDLESLR